MEEAMDYIVTLRDALVTVYSDKRKLESEIEALKVQIAEITAEKVSRIYDKISLGRSI